MQFEQYLQRESGINPITKHRIDSFTAITIAFTSLLIGILGNILFFRHPEGINIPLFIGAFLLTSLGLLIFFKHKIFLHNAIFAVPTAIFAILLSIYAAPELAFFNFCLMSGGLFIFIRFSTTAAFLGGNLINAFLSMIEMLLIGWLEGPLNVLSESMAWFNTREVDPHRIARVKAVLRGLMLTIPILIVFGLLLGSADIVFGDLLINVFSFIQIDRLDDIIAQCILVGIFAWLAMMGFKLLLVGPISTLSENIIRPTQWHSLRLSMIEAVMVLASVDFLFLVFSLIQARYLFGGEANITAQGYTYAEYARRGFFEILAVSCMTLCLLLVLDAITHRKKEHEYIFQTLSVTLILLTFILLIAAFQRLRLYESAFGYTRQRVMSGVFMIWLGLLFTVVIRDILVREKKWFLRATILMGIGFVLTLNLMNMDAFIARQNIERYEDTGKLDVLYLTQLSDDAIPVIVPLLDNESLSDSMRTNLLIGLGERLYSLDAQRENRSSFGYHFSKHRAWEALDARRATLQEYIRPSYRYSDY